jgi:fibronectin type 3 domain-containing protein
MGLIFNGNTIDESTEEIIFNGSSVESVIFNGSTIWAKGFTKPDVPQNLTATNNLYGRIDLAWDEVAGSTSYIVFRDGGFYKLVFTNSFSDKDVLFGIPYTYTVAACKNKKCSGHSNEVIGKSWIEGTIPVPEAPANFNATDDLRNSIVLTWDKAPGYVHHYNIYRGDGTDFTIVAGVYADEFIYEDYNIENNTTYTYYVTAENYTGEGPASNTDTGITVKEWEAPTAPTDVSATKGEYDSFVLVDWKAPPEYVGRYEVYRSDAADGTFEYLETTDKFRYLDGSVSGTDHYFYKVMACNILGCSALSEPPAEGWANVAAGVPTAPTNLSASTDIVGAINLIWDSSSPDVMYYNIYRDGVKIAETPNTTFSDKSVWGNINYEYFVTAHNYIGNSAPSNIATGMALPLLNAPDPVNTLDASDGKGGRVEVLWTDEQPPNLVQYYIIKRQDPYDEANPPDPLPPFESIDKTQDIQYYEDYTAVPDDIYTYMVTAYNFRGESTNNPTDKGHLVVPAAPLEPINCMASDKKFSWKVNIQWGKDHASDFVQYYEVSRVISGGLPEDSIVIGTVDGRTFEFNDFTAESSSVYDYAVKAYNIVGGSGFSNWDAGSVSDDLGLPPPVPGFCDASDGAYEDYVRIQWGYSHYEAGYAVYRSENNTDFTQIATITNGD